MFSTPIERPSSSGEKGTCNINILNTELLRSFDVLEEAKKSPSQLPPLDISKIMHRTELSIMERQRIGIGVSPMAKKLFDQVSKT